MEYFLVSISIGFLIIKLILLGIFIGFSSRSRSKLKYLLEGIQKQKRCRVFTYFSHFIFYRLSLAILVLLSPFYQSKILLGIAFGIQFLSFCLHIIKLYSRWILYLQIIAIWELNLLFCISLMFGLQFTENKNAIYGLVIVWVNMAFSILFSLFGFL